MFDCVCIECKVVFSAKTMFSKLCGSKCSMRRYRRTDKGKANVRWFNEKVKRNGVSKVCFCGKGFTTVRNARYCSEACYRASSSYKESRRLGRIKWRKDHKVAHSANKKVTASVKAGRIVKPDVCEECKITNIVEGHHDDYSKPYEVRWLCNKCHNDFHVGLRGIAQ